MNTKTSLLEWALAEPNEDDDNHDSLAIGQFMQIKKKNEIAHSFCNVCGKTIDGYNCGQNPQCPFEAPLFI